MKRTYERHGFTLEVTVESDFIFRPTERTIVCADYVVMVRVIRDGQVVAILPPIRLGTVDGQPFASEADALMSGYGAGRRIVDNLPSKEITHPHD
ncbi:hypothetical protein [Paraburkholderia sacchari]|uniref:hypothetical protein n=1 Tax=Paraburkholderia sacchari TaxID=159450 RepID=UPI0005438875|nr:hypothetical protein [Paraburkholderia sacchari]NLP60169.1 hypothetical protein [Paraburkholderia sacchari]